jgi:hypothetical protein
VVVNTSEFEFEYSSGEKNVYTRYQGRVGVVLENFWRKFLFGWKLDGTVFPLSSYPTQESRDLYYRRVQERVRRLARSSSSDHDPYVAAVDGRFVCFSYSQPFQFP